ncbi:restriction endonuclease [candidate division LCP-89 bacterium B3_LCP]|uniref:Restriction endonuclease n=1 Tax=candidate division LCP-89 bacterium B3_LCP TaxID=2012998 RepID=A0A532URQ3_UNCL8|nr:MAG: restriction endonuclease [candidate division LCP-89 bacterium B3_LCP]
MPGKKDVFLFFRGAGVEKRMMEDIYSKWKMNPDSVNKFEIARTIITQLNELGEKAIKERREILKRVTEFEDFSTCWPNDQLKAKGLVVQIQSVVDVKDSFTRMKIEKDRERQQRLFKENEEREAIRLKQESIDCVKAELFGLFSLDNPHKRGKAFEGVLNKLFSAFEISVRESFTLKGDTGEGVIEQIDGVVEIDAHFYFVEVKWWDKPLGVGEISQHLVRVYHRAEGRAIIISASDFTEPAITTCKEALQKKVVILCTLREIVTLLESKVDLKTYLNAKIKKAVIEKMPYYTPSVGSL